MIREFEGTTEKDAIEKAIEELNLDRGEFDVEIVEEGKKGLFRKGSVRIKVYLDDREEDIPAPGESSDESFNGGNEPNYNRIEYHDPKGAGPSRAPMHGRSHTRSRAPSRTPMDAPSRAPMDPASHTRSRPPSRAPMDTSSHTPMPPLNATEEEGKAIRFLTEVIKRMGYESTVSVVKREDNKAVFSVESKNSGILIGRKGKNLDALQLLANVYAGRLSTSMKIVVDAENYRLRREENLVRLAKKTADQVRKSRNSRLLEPMNPFERRLIHTALNSLKDIETKSEGDGLYKQVRVIYKGN